ncbi:hypothetical protein M0657_009529 [Pyricularia oryzae]|uniref:Uncharacterized protein n=1 Tax=Pyricularia oryzae (strain P131) TaxID=1143193 RepID=L7JIU2_PYRO1|nr:hypothetical protein M9X92_009459 [Pyricularia oryzae]KAI7914363.1 hypothetical protein M0657_009529 [Pyricularia oryzae]
MQGLPRIINLYGPIKVLTSLRHLSEVGSKHKAYISVQRRSRICIPEVEDVYIEALTLDQPSNPFDARPSGIA